ncbi:MAG: hypothetical protein PHW13_10600 [Methylococcales bacterium]|nr:hypothetical protein [Methylococcales bacterium]
MGKSIGSDLFNIPKTDVLATLDLILASNEFINAPRMCRLLRFLVEKAISGSGSGITEYAIGLEVFDRNPSNYSTNEDPIVRVQAGRLREKLRKHYTTFNTSSDIVISIPKGSYIPVIQHMNVTETCIKRCRLLGFQPFKCISPHKHAISFTQGLNEELKHQLFNLFGKQLSYIPCYIAGDLDNENRTLQAIFSSEITHLLEGSVQTDAERIRASIRLVDVSDGCIICSEQFDRKIFFVMSHQQELASSICNTVRRYTA